MSKNVGQIMIKNDFTISLISLTVSRWLPAHVPRYLSSTKMDRVMPISEAKMSAMSYKATSITCPLIDGIKIDI